MDRDRPHQGIPLQDAVVSIELTAGRNRLLKKIWILVQLPIRGVNWPSLIPRYVVVRDISDNRVVYSEGPYTSGTVQMPLKKVVAELESNSLAEFMHKRSLEQSRIGPIAESSGYSNFVQRTIFSASYRFRSIWRRVSRK